MIYGTRYSVAYICHYYYHYFNYYSVLSSLFKNNIKVINDTLTNIFNYRNFIPSKDLTYNRKQ